MTGGNYSLKIPGPSSNGLGLMVCQSISDRGVFRTAPATQGLLNIPNIHLYCPTPTHVIYLHVSDGAFGWRLIMELYRGQMQKLQDIFLLRSEV